jgi:hypothetical protein
MDKASKAAVLVVTIVVAIVQISFTVIAFAHINGAFEVIVVSLLGFIYLSVVQHGKDFDEARLENMVVLSRIRAVVNGGTEEEIPEELEEKLKRRANHAVSYLITTISEVLIAIIIVWNFVKTIFFP